MWVTVITLACTGEQSFPERRDEISLLQILPDVNKWDQGVVELDQENEREDPEMQAARHAASAETKIITGRVHELTAKALAKAAIATGAPGDHSDMHLIIKTGGRAAAQAAADVATIKMNAEHEANQKLKVKLGKAQRPKKGGEKATKAAKKSHKGCHKS